MFLKNVTRSWNIYLYGHMGYKMFFEKFLTANLI